MMDNIPSLNDLLNYGDDYQYPDLIMSDYFKIDKKIDDTKNNVNDEPKEEESSKQQNDELNEESSERQNDELKEESSKQQNDGLKEESSEQQNDEPKEEKSSEQQNDELKEEGSSERQNDELKEESLEQQNDENDFDDLMDNYNEYNNFNHDTSEAKGSESPSDKLDNITTTKIYKVLKKLVSLSYERYERGIYKYDKKDIVKHYLTNQKFRIINDMIGPTFKPDVYVFDLSPSNNESLEMYVNAISSVAIKNSLIYLTYNDRILRKLTIKKENAKSINVGKIANSQMKKYSNFDCEIFNEYQSLYEELREIKDRKIYIFSDFDISSDISKLSQENQEIVWFSTERSNYGSSIYSSFLYREFPSLYIG